jgi:hypothetical protein
VGDLASLVCPEDIGAGLEVDADPNTAGTAPELTDGDGLAASGVADGASAVRPPHATAETRPTAIRACRDARILESELSAGRQEGQLLVGLAEALAENAYAIP